jgi:hypothetical protein
MRNHGTAFVMCHEGFPPLKRTSEHFQLCRALCKHLDSWILDPVSFAAAGAQRHDCWGWAARPTEGCGTSDFWLRQYFAQDMLASVPSSIMMQNSSASQPTQHASTAKLHPSRKAQQEDRPLNICNVFCRAWYILVVCEIYLTLGPLDLHLSCFMAGIVGWLVLL